MFISQFGDKGLKAQLNILKAQQNDLNQKIRSTEQMPNGVSSFVLFTLKKQHKELQKQMTQINKLINPDIIA